MNALEAPPGRLAETARRLAAVEQGVQPDAVARALVDALTKLPQT